MLFFICLTYFYSVFPIDICATYQTKPTVPGGIAIPTGGQHYLTGEQTLTQHWKVSYTMSMTEV